MATIRETNFELPGQVEAYHGKVGDTYTIDHEAGELLAVVRSDRISAFDRVLPQTIPYKGQVLNQMSTALLDATSLVSPNWLIEAPDPNVSIGYKAQSFKVEMIVRGFLLGSAWKAYSEDNMRKLCGNKIPDGMHEFDQFREPLLTPTTKAAVGHDENITPAEIVESGLATPGEVDVMTELSFSLFAAGSHHAWERGLVLADTKYEFGRLATGRIVLIDEVHTPDSSRYYNYDEYNNYLNGRNKGKKRPKQQSKEYVREWLKEQGFSGEPGQEPPDMPDNVVDEVSRRYRGLYEEMLAKPFKPAVEDSEADMQERIRENIVRSLGELAAA